VVVVPDRNEDTGRYRREYPLELFLTAVDELELATTSKVTEKVGCSYDLTYRRLNELEKQGNLTKQEIGGSFVWEKR
jgi:hypothetical protein